MSLEPCTLHPTAFSLHPPNCTVICRVPWGLPPSRASAECTDGTTLDCIGTALHFTALHCTALSCSAPYRHCSALRLVRPLHCSPHAALQAGPIRCKPDGSETGSVVRQAGGQLDWAGAQSQTTGTQPDWHLQPDATAAVLTQLQQPAVSRRVRPAVSQQSWPPQ